MTEADKFILIAVIGRAQGLAGQVRLKFFSETAQSLAQYGCFYGKDGTVYPVKSMQIHRGLPIAALKGVESREQAELLAGAELFIKRSQLPVLAEDDEFYQEDLLGFAAVSETGGYIGAVSGFFNFGGGDLLELTLPPAKEAEGARRGEAEAAADKGNARVLGEAARAKGKARVVGEAARAKGKMRAGKVCRPKSRKELIPFSKAAVPQVDLQKRQIVVRREAAGLVLAGIGAG